MSELITFNSIDDFWKWVHAIPEREVNLSHSFIAKNRCRKCGKHPTEYYNVRFPSFVYDPRTKITQNNWMMAAYKLVQSDFYVVGRYLKPADLCLSTQFKSYSPHLHRTKGLATNMVEYAVCKCGNSVWAFSDMYGVTPEKIHRLSKNTYPIKLKYY